MTWTVVEFIDSRTVEAVPTKWILNQRCYWPTQAREKLMSDIKNNVTPDPSWPLYRIRIFKDSTFDDYLIARIKAKKAEETSDLNSDEDISKRKIVPRKIYSSDSEESEIMNIESPPVLIEKTAAPIRNKAKGIGPKVIRAPFLGAAGCSVPDSESLSDNEPREIPDKGSSKNRCNNVIKDYASLVSTNLLKEKDVASSSCNCNCCPIHQKITEKYLQEILKKQSFLRVQLVQIQDDVNMMKGSKGMCNPDSDQEENFLKKFKFPIETAEDLNLVEIYLTEPRQFNKAGADLVRIGGDDVYDIIRRCMFSTFTNTYASTFSFFGTKEKNIFKDLKLCELVIEVAIKKNGVDRKAAENALKKWLRRAKERCPKEK